MNDYGRLLKWSYGGLLVWSCSRENLSFDLSRNQNDFFLILLPKILFGRHKEASVFKDQSAKPTIDKPLKSAIKSIV